MRIFQTSTLRFKEIDELILDEQGTFETIDSVIYMVYLTAEEYAEAIMEKYVHEAITNGIKVYSGLARTGKLEILCANKIMNNTQYMVEFVSPMDKAELLESLMLKFAAANRDLMATG